MLCIYDIIAAEEKQATAKQAFAFPAALTSKRLTESNGEREARVCECKNARVCECKNARVCECRNARVCECRNARVCECRCTDDIVTKEHQYI